jgi:transposase
MKKVFTASQKAAVVIDAFSTSKSIAEISSSHSVHATQIGAWKKQAKEILVSGFSDKRKRETADYAQQIADLQQLLGKRDMELEWLKKKCSPLAT